jgi:hypothetical protein
MATVNVGDSMVVTVKVSSSEFNAEDEDHFRIIPFFYFLTNYVIYTCRQIKKCHRRAFFIGYLCQGPYSTRGGGDL